MPLNTNFKFRFFRFSSVTDDNKLIFVIYSSAMLVGIVLLIKNVISENYYSSFADLIEIIGFLIAIHLFFERKFFFGAHLVASFVTCIAILITSYFEGLKTGAFILYTPIIFVIPFIISRHKDYKKLIYISYSILAFFFIMALVISPEYSNNQIITDQEAHDSILLYASVSFFLIMICSIAFLLVEKKYIEALKERKTIAIEERDSRTRILSNLGHELRTQINGINSATQLISEEFSKIDNSTSLIKYTQMLDYCNNQMLVLVNDILDLHKIEINKLKLSLSENNIFELIDNVSLPFENRQTKNQLIPVEIVKDIDPVLKNTFVLLDDSRLMQILHNLLSNAIKFTKRGKVRLTVKCVQESKFNIKVLFSVKDTGIGIAPEEQENIFKSFVQINSPDYKPLYSGTGLGLSISKSIIEAMGGVIKLKSELNKGSDFYFTLNFPKADKKEQTLSILNNPKEDLSFLKGKTILLAEDNPISMMYTQKLLEKYDIKLVKAINGLEAVNFVKNLSHIDLVLLDLEMPIMTGFEAIKKIKKIKPLLKVIAFTANIPGDLLINRLEALGFSSIIPKPFTKDEIINTLHCFLVDESVPFFKKRKYLV